MVYASTTVVIIYWNPGQPLVIHISRHVWFHEYNYRLSIWDKHAASSLLLNNILKVSLVIQTSSTWFYVKLILHLLRFVIQKFSHMKFIYLLLERKDYEYFKIPYVTDTIPNLPAVHQLPAQAKKMCGAFPSM